MNPLLESLCQASIVVELLRIHQLSGIVGSPFQLLDRPLDVPLERLLTSDDVEVQPLEVLEVLVEQRVQGPHIPNELTRGLREVPGKPIELTADLLVAEHQPFESAVKPSKEPREQTRLSVLEAADIDALEGLAAVRFKARSLLGPSTGVMTNPRGARPG